MTAANTNPALQKVQADEAPKLAAHQDAISLNEKLFARVAAVYKQRESLKLDPESQRQLQVTTTISSALAQIFPTPTKPS